MSCPPLLTTVTSDLNDAYKAAIGCDHAAYEALIERAEDVTFQMAMRFNGVADYQRLVVAMESVVYALDEEAVRLPYPAASSVMRDLLLANPARWADVCAPPRPMTLPTPWWTLAWWGVTPRRTLWGRVRGWVGRILGRHIERNPDGQRLA